MLPKWKSDPLWNEEIDQINPIEEIIFMSSSFISLFKETKGLLGGPTDQPISWSAALTGMGFVVAKRDLKRGCSISCK